MLLNSRPYHERPNQIVMAHIRAERDARQDRHPLLALGNLATKLSETTVGFVRGTVMPVAVPFLGRLVGHTPDNRQN